MAVSISPLDTCLCCIFAVSVGLGRTHLQFFLCPQLQRSWRGILVSGCASVCPLITLFDACHILWTMHARVLKFHIWIPHGKIADTLLFSYPSHLPFRRYAPLKKSEWNLMHAISYEPCMLVLKFHIWKNSWHTSFFLVQVISLFWVMPLWKNRNKILSARSQKVFELGAWSW